MFRTLRKPEDASLLTESDGKLLDLLSEHPYSLNEAGEKLGIHPLNFNIDKMESLGFIQRIGLTPTDILH